MEEWKDIVGSTGYQISNQGRVKSSYLLNHKKEPYLKLYSNRKGYLLVSIINNGKQRSIAVHRLVGLHFIPNPERKKELNHIDGNKCNNSISNLEWNTPSENAQHAVRTGLRVVPFGENGSAAKLKETQVLEIRSAYRQKNISQKKLCELYNVAEATIHSIIHNKSWKHLK